MIVAWAPRPDVAERLEPEPLPTVLAGGGALESLAPGRAHGGGTVFATRATPLAPERFALQVTIDRATHDKLERAQALLRHRVPSGDLVQVIDRALDALLDKLVKEKFAATARPRRRRAPDAADTCAVSGPGDVAVACATGGLDGTADGCATGGLDGTADGRATGGLDGAADGCATGARGEATVRRTRHVPAEVRRAVHERDGEQCTFVSVEGAQCTERGFLELDHVEAFAAGGPSTPANLRVLCAPHNAHAAERRFGRPFMERRRRRSSEAVGRVAGGAVAAAVPASPASSTEAPAVPDVAAEVMLGLRGLGVAPADARDALARSAHVPATTLAERLRAALQALRVTYANRSAEAMRPWGGEAGAGSRAWDGGRAAA